MGYYYMPYFDYSMLILIPAIIFSLYAQTKIQATFNKYMKVYTTNGLTGSEAARRILDRNGLYDIPVEVTTGRLSDHYDPSSRTLRLSKDVYYGNTVSSVGVAAHEAGHAIQHGTGYAPLSVRNSLVPVANIGSNLSWVLLVLGIIFSFPMLVSVGIYMFCAVVAFQIITLPVEYNASHRAIEQLEGGGMLYGGDLKGARSVLNAAALTYVAAAIRAIAQLLRLLLISRNRRD